MKIAIETSKLTKYFGSIVAVDKLNLKVKAGTIHGLVGENGAGKSTTLKMLAGITQPSSGEIRLLGYPLSSEGWPYHQSIPEKVKRQIAYIPENPSAYETLTVREFLSFVGELYRVPPRLHEQRMEECIKTFEMGPHLQRYIGDLSKGWLQRTLICAMMVRKPVLMLLDEPFYALDPVASWKLKNYLKEAKEEGRTTLLVTQVLEVAERICDYITVLKGGRIIASGSLADLRRESGGHLSLEDIFLKLTGRVFA